MQDPKAADVPVTLFLSGGVDSSLVQAVLMLDTSYTLQFAEFEETINEKELVLEFAQKRGFDARIVTPTRDDFFATFSELARFIEFPVGSFSVFPLFCLSRAARRDGYVVALSGEGADELFNGYFRNELLLREASALQPDLDGPYGTLCKRYFGSALERFCRMASREGAGGVPLLLDFLVHAGGTANLRPEPEPAGNEGLPAAAIGDGGPLEHGELAGGSEPVLGLSHRGVLHEDCGPSEIPRRPGKWLCAVRYVSS